jgi:hypothetical protein
MTMEGHCPRCGPNRQADVVGEHQTKWDNGDVWGRLDYRILQCRGCNDVYFQVEEIFSEDQEVRANPVTGEGELYLPPKFTYWPPPPKRPKPDWIFQLDDISLLSLLEEIYAARNNDLDVLCAIGIRTAFDRASELLSVDPNQSFSAKLTELETRGDISRKDKETLDTLVDAGSAAAHRGWRPRQHELDTMMGIIEGFLQRKFILEASASKMKQRVPQRPKRHP